MKALILSLLLPCIAWAGPGRDVWRKADKKSRAQIIEAYQGWFATHAEKNAGEFADWQEKKTTYLRIFADAWATEGMNCIYAGWPSKKQGESCSSPATQNPDYSRGTCSASQMQCQPLLFGAGLCVSVATRNARNTAFSNCNRSFQSSGRSLESVVEEAISGGKEAQLLSLLDFADQICTSGSQAGSGMCERLKEKVAAIRAKIPEKEIEVLSNGAQVPDSDERTALLNAVGFIPALQPVDPVSAVRACVPQPPTGMTQLPPGGLVLRNLARVPDVPAPDVPAPDAPVPDAPVPDAPVPAPAAEPAQRDVAAVNTCFQDSPCRPYNEQSDVDSSEDDLYNRAVACENAAHALGQGHPCFLSLINSVSVIGNKMELKRLAVLEAADRLRAAEYQRQVDEAAARAEVERQAWERGQVEYRQQRAEYEQKRAEYEREMRARGLEPEPER